MPYVLEYRSELSKWTAAAERYCAMLTDAGTRGRRGVRVRELRPADDPFRFEEATLEMRETAADGRDLIKARRRCPGPLAMLWRGFITRRRPRDRS